MARWASFADFFVQAMPISSITPPLICGPSWVFHFLSPNFLLIWIAPFPSCFPCDILELDLTSSTNSFSFMSKFDVFFNFIRVFYPIDKLWMPLAFFQRFFKSFSLQMHYLHLFSTPLDSLLPPSF